MKIIVLLLFFSSCARPKYLIEQGLGQMSLLSRGEWNDSLLKDDSISKKDKDKILKIIKYKKWFYDYWNKKEKKIYSKTTFLEGEAVTWLVIASPYDKILAKKECFPILGCFPYLGFFKKDSAFQHIRALKDQGYATYMRPVYAYSTLGYFTDTILSSFFYYKDFELAELIFHELFHTIFFAKDEVDLNENLANFFGRELASEYFKLSSGKILKEKERRNKNAEINQEISKLALKLNEKYQLFGELTKEKSQGVLKKFMKETFLPTIQLTCRKLNISLDKCFPLKRSWNNASLASYLTYEKSLDKIGRLRLEKKMTLQEYFSYINEKYQKYLEEDPHVGFSKYLLK